MSERPKWVEGLRPRYRITTPDVPKGTRMTAEQRAQRINEPMTEVVRNAIAMLAGMISETTDWLKFKRHFLIEIPSIERQLFSFRDGKTKKHPPFNAYERQVREEWKRLTGNTLLMPPEKMLSDPSEYE